VIRNRSALVIAGDIMQAYLCYHACMPAQLTIRGLSEELSRRLTRLSRERGQSINTTVLVILEDALDSQARRRRLARYATWTPADMKEFDDTLADQRVVDDDLWR
jgi:plasmid stability protein